MRSTLQGIIKISSSISWNAFFHKISFKIHQESVESQRVDLKVPDLMAIC
uniref:Uncharacterized protein n=1 Tax=Tetranychus urticae TaxID=32264 RepID=T1KY88_TETUR